jgi:hypothetical protein
MPGSVPMGYLLVMLGSIIASSVELQLIHECGESNDRESVDLKRDAVRYIGPKIRK